MPSVVTAIIAAEFLQQSQKHVCKGAYDHYNYMETRLYLRCNKLKLSNSHVGVSIDLTINDILSSLNS